MKSHVKKISVLLLLTGLIWGNTIVAQTFEEYKKQRQQEMQKYKEDREKQLQLLADEYTNYIKERDKEYTEYLQQRWKEMQVFKGIEPPKEPKPVDVPKYTPPARPKPPQNLPVIKPDIEIEKEPVQAPILPRIVKKEPPKFPVASTQFNFYGNPLEFTYDQKLGTPFRAKIVEEAIGNHWMQLSSTNYNHLVDQLLAYKEISNLNDWGYYQLVKKTSESIVGSDINSQRMLTWFLLIRSGYKAKLAFLENEVYVLLPASNQVYGINFFTFDNLQYYIMDSKLASVFTYEKDFPEATKVFDLNIYYPLAFGGKTAEKDFNYTYEGIPMPLKINYNSDLISFYKDYPLSDIKVYFDASVSPEAKESLAEGFAPYLKGKSELESANLLLNFVQTAFQYKTDQDQFGYEKFFFAEEAFFYPYCDCEDRSVLFSYLVKRLLGLEVVGLDYPGHIATAICFNQQVEGDYITYNGKKYVIADPTYINAPVGMTMKDYAGVQANIVPLSNSYTEGKAEDMVWLNVIAAGGNKGDNRNDVIIDQDGNAIVAGYFTDQFKMGSLNIKGSGNPSMFVVSVNKNMIPNWFVNAGGEGISIAYGVARDTENNIYVSGTIDGDMTLGNSVLTSTAPDVFIIKVNSRGQLIWAQRAGIDSVNQENPLNYVAKFDLSGKHLGNDLYLGNPDFNNYGITITPSDEIYIAGAFNKTTGMNVNKLSFNEIKEFNPVTALKEENDNLVGQNYEKSIAGLFAVVSLLKSSGVTIPGTDAQAVLDKYNPKFKTSSPEIYSNIGKIQFIKNNNGVVVVKTSDGKDVYFDMMRVKSDSKVKVSLLESGDARLDILSGIRVGKAFIWFDLNYVEMYKKNGDMLFDYDKDHSQKKMNLKNDILY